MASPSVGLGDTLPSLKTSKLTGIQILKARKASLETNSIQLGYLLVVVQLARSIFSKNWCALPDRPLSGLLLFSLEKCG